MSTLRQCGALVAARTSAAYSTTKLLQRQTAVNALVISGKREHHLLLRQSWAKMGQTSMLAAAAASSAPTLAAVVQRGHKKFGHGTETTPRLTKYFHAFVTTLFLVSVLDFRKIKKAIMPKVDADIGADEPEPQDVKSKFKKAKKANDEIDSKDKEECESAKLLPSKEKQGFRERKIIEYENRIRQFSTPDKIFRYFATVRLTTSSGSEICMTPDDFLRSFYPGSKQPEGLGLDQYRRYDPKSVTDCLDLNLEKNSIFYKLGSYGLITFSDYIFLLTVLSTSRRHFEIAFQMFDLNGDGDVDCEEFEQVANLVRQQTSIGNRHRDHAATGNTFKGVNSALTTYFFGKNLDQKLTIEKFTNFQTQLQREILSLEFERKSPNENGLISEVDFAELLVAYAGYSAKKKARKLKRVKRKFRESGSGISKQDYLDFFHFLSNINDVDTALTFYHIAGASIDQDTLKHVAKTVAMVNLRDHVVDVIFTIFDEDNDNQLSNREFVAVMKNRLLRGLEKAKDTGFIKLMRGIFKCARDTKPVLLDI